MATNNPAHPRQSWLDILNEAKRCAGGVQYASFESRLKNWLTDAYFRICLTYHHYELHRAIVTPLAIGESRVSLPSDCFIVMSVAEVEVVTRGTGDVRPPIIKPLLVLQNRNETLRQGVYKTTSGRPQSYSRSGSMGAALQFDCRTDAARKYEIQYYMVPDAPRWREVNYPSTHRVWDESILDMALVRIGARTWVPDLMTQGQQLLADYLGQQVQPAQVDSPVADLPDTNRADQPRGGLQG